MPEVAAVRLLLPAALRHLCLVHLVHHEIVHPRQLAASAGPALAVPAVRLVASAAAADPWWERLRVPASNFPSLCQPQFDQLRDALPVLARLLHSNDEEVLTDACWALSYLSDGTNDKIQAVIDAGVARRLVELLLHNSAAVLIPALRTVGNIVTGDDVQTQIVINCQALPCLLNLLQQGHKKSIKKEACWTISNIIAGNKDQIQAIIDAQIIGPLIHLLAEAEFDIKKG